MRTPRPWRSACRRDSRPRSRRIPHRRTAAMVEWPARPADGSGSRTWITSGFCNRRSTTGRRDTTGCGRTRSPAESVAVTSFRRDRNTRTMVSSTRSADVHRGTMHTKRSYMRVGRRCLTRGRRIWNHHRADHTFRVYRDQQMTPPPADTCRSTTLATHPCRAYCNTRTGCCCTRCRWWLQFALAHHKTYCPDSSHRTTCSASRRNSATTVGLRTRTFSDISVLFQSCRV